MLEKNIIEPIWVEIKHWLIGLQRGTQYRADSYFKDSTSVGTKLDVEKLLKLKVGKKYLLILTTANPGCSEWSNGINIFNKKFSPLRIRGINNPKDFNDYYYLGLLKVLEVNQ